MQIVLIEQEMRDKEEALKRCKYYLAWLKQARNPKYKETIWELTQEQFLLEDQLAHYKTVFNLLEEDQETFDSVPKRI